MEKKIKYTARDFEAIKSELIAFSKKYYPELSDSWNDASVGAWMIDLVSSVGDSLNYNMDRIFQETNINSANSRSSVLNAARLNGVKIPGPKSSMCEVELTCTLPTNSTNLAEPNWSDAPLVKRGSVVGNMDYHFELLEDVDFSEQFNSDGYSNRTFKPKRDNNGLITAYTVTKSVLVVSGKSKIYKRVISEDELVPFMEIVLPEQGITNVESVIFKNSSKIITDPQLYEYFIDAEEYQLKGDDTTTYRYFEVNSLAEQYRFGDVTNMSTSDNTLVADPIYPSVYTDYTEGTKTTRYYHGEWKAITQKFMTEYTDNEYLKLIFGGATEEVTVPSKGTTTYAQHMMSKMINNPMLGLLPQAGWTMYVLYRTGGGSETNLAQGAINTIVNLNMTFPKMECYNGTTAQLQSQIANSFTVYNPTTSIGGKDFPSTEEIKYLTKYSTSSQERCVTLKDYKARLMQIPPRYGCPFRLNVAEDNNKVSMSVLNLNSEGKLSKLLPKTLVDNMKEYLSHYKSLTDYVEIRSGKYYNLGFQIDVFVDKNYTVSDVVSSIINTVKDYMDISKHDMGEDIFLGDLEKNITSLDGVISLINVGIHNIYGGNYGEQCPLPIYVDVQYGTNCNTVTTTPEAFVSGNGANSVQIDTNALDKVLYCDVDSMWEIRYPDNDIKVRVKLK